MGISKRQSFFSAFWPPVHTEKLLKNLAKRTLSQMVTSSRPWTHGFHHAGLLCSPVNVNCERSSVVCDDNILSAPTGLESLREQFFWIRFLRSLVEWDTFHNTVGAYWTGFFFSTEAVPFFCRWRRFPTWPGGPPEGPGRSTWPGSRAPPWPRSRCAGRRRPPAALQSAPHDREKHG